MKQRKLTPVDLEPCIGTPVRVAEVLNYRRSLTLEMIRNLSNQLGIPAQLLVQRYDLRLSARRPTHRAKTP